MTDLTTLLLVLGLVWILNLVMSGFQTKRFHQRVFQIRKHGSYTAVGQSGTNIKLKQYVVLVVDTDEDTQEDTVIIAERLSGVTVFASLKSVPELVGKTLRDIESGERPAAIPAKTWSAARSAASFIRTAQKRDTEKNETDESEFAVDTESMTAEANSDPPAVEIGGDKQERAPNQTGE